jgi:hypothetical protein
LEAVALFKRTGEIRPSRDTRPSEEGKARTEVDRPDRREDRAVEGEIIMAKVEPELLALRFRDIREGPQPGGLTEEEEEGPEESEGTEAELPPGTEGSEGIHRSRLVQPSSTPEEAPAGDGIPCQPPPKAEAE